MRTKRSDLKKMEEIAEKYNKTTAQLLLRWNIQQGIIPIPKSKNEQRLQQNIDVFDFEITKEDIEKMTDEIMATPRKLNAVPFKVTREDVEDMAAYLA